MKLAHKTTVFLLIALACGSLSAYGLAQTKPPVPEKRTTVSDAGTAESACTHGDMDCPMHKLPALAEVKVEKTKTGATLLITAKDITKVSEVQALVEKVAAHMKAGDCPMMHGTGGHQHGHDHAEHGEHGKMK